MHLLACLLLEDRSASDLPDRKPGRELRREALRPPARCDDRLTLVHQLAGLDEVENQVLGIADLRPDHSLHADGHDLPGDGAGGVGDQRHLSRAVLHRGIWPTRPSPLITGSSTRMPSLLPASTVTTVCQSVGERVITRAVTSFIPRRPTQAFGPSPPVSATERSPGEPPARRSPPSVPWRVPP